MKTYRKTHSRNHAYTTPAMRVRTLIPCFPVCLQTSNGAATENYEEEDIWNN